MRRIGVRELRQHASRYLALVAGGEQIEVTDRGKPLAILVPVRANAWDALLASHRVVTPQDERDIAEEEPADYGVDASSVLRAMRELER
jgi:prevent-host-death family protein